jgi:hypothetical protein
MAAASAAAVARASPTASSIAARSGSIQASNPGRATGAADRDAGPTKVEVGGRRRRQRQLGVLDRAVQRQPEILLDDAHQPADAILVARAVGDALEQRHGVGALEHRQVVPAAQPVVDPRRHRRLVAELDLVLRALAQGRRDDRVDHPRVERVAGQRDAALGQHPRAAGRPGLDHREVAGAAAEVGDQHALVAIEPRGVGVGGGDRLGGEGDLVEAGQRQRGAHPRDRALVVGRRLGAPVGTVADDGGSGRRRGAQLLQVGAIRDPPACRSDRGDESSSPVALD